MSIYVQVISEGAKAVAGGAFHSIALKKDGTIWATGSNQHGQFGDGSSVSTKSYVKIQEFGDGETYSDNYILIGLYLHPWASLLPWASVPRPFDTTSLSSPTPLDIAPNIHFVILELYSTLDITPPLKITPPLGLTHPLDLSHPLDLTPPLDITPPLDLTPPLESPLHY